MKFCPQCGSELKEGAKFCASCGFQIIAQPTASTPPPAPEPQASWHSQEPVYDQAKQASHAFTESVTGKTNLIQRVINLIVKPKEEWLVIASEKPDKMKILFGYVIILALIPAVTTFITFTLISSFYSITYAIIQAIVSFILTIAVIYLTAYIVDLLAPSFESEVNFDRSFQLVSYAYTPGWIVSILGVIPGINFIALLAGFVYMVYLLITGIPVLKKTATDKATGYAILLIVIMFIIYLIIAAMFAFVFFKLLFKGLMYPGIM